jgi:hypothetical protein
LFTIVLLSYLAIPLVERRPTRVTALNARQDARMPGGPATRLDREVRYRTHHQDEAVPPYLGFTQLFADVPEPIYTDDCCHFDERGYEPVGAYAAEVLLDELGLGLVR